MQTSMIARRRGERPAGAAAPTLAQPEAQGDGILAVTVNEAVRRSGIPRTNLYALMGDGSLPFYHVGRHRLILVTDLRAIIVARPGSARARRNAEAA